MAIRRLEEIKLLALCMASDNRDAFSRLVEIHQQGLRRFLLNLTGGDENLTDDVAQETFIKAWMAIRSFHGLSGFRTWHDRIALNELSNYRRLSGRMETTPVDNPALHIADTSAPSPDARMDAAALIRTLPDNERTVVLLFYLEEMTLKEISKITCMPEGTVKSHLSRARSRLRSLV